jgi:hypothetical protein
VREIVDSLREVIRRIIPTAEETVLWGGLSYHRPWIGGRVKGAVCQIGTKHGTVRLDFIHGIALNDLHGLLEGTRLSKRFVTIPSVDDTARPEVADLIRQAAAFVPIA